MRTNDDITLWQLFFRVVERGSISKAAEDLQLEPSVASRRIAALEKRLNVQLLHRSTRNVSVAPAGERAYERMRPLIEDMEGVLADLDTNSPVITGTIRLTAPVNFGESYVTDWLTEFQCQHPGIVFDLILSDTPLDLMMERIDIAIRIGEMPSSDLVAKKLGMMPNILCASPSYIQKWGMPERPSDLANHRAIVYSLNKEKYRARLTMERGGIERSVKLSGVFFINNVGAIQRAVLNGVGIHAGPLWLFKETLPSGELIQLLPDWNLPKLPVHLVRLKSRYVPQRLTILYNWLQKCWEKASLNG